MTDNVQLLEEEEKKAFGSYDKMINFRNHGREEKNV